MATFTIISPTVITSLAGKTGNDTYNINGGTLTIDCDSRYAPSASATTGPIGNLTVSASLGGRFQVTTATTVLVPFSGSTGILPTYGSTITQGTATGVLLCVMSDRTGGTVLAGGISMPANGWLKLRRTSTDQFTVGALTAAGAVFSAVQPEEQGWIVLVGVQDRAHNHPRLGTMQFQGHWFQAGQTSGIRGQTLQLPHFTDDAVTAYPGVEVETAPGSGVYQFWPNAGMRFTSTTCSTDSRSSFVYISETGVLTFGLDSGGLVCGHLPDAGCNVRIPTIITQTCATTNLNLTIRPPGTIGARYESVFSSAGLADIRNVTGAWYWSIVQPYSCYIRNLHSCDQVVIQEVATPVDIDGLHQGLSVASAPFASNGVAFQQCYNGGVVGSVSWLRAEATSTAGYAAVFVNLYGGWTFNKLRGGHIGVPTAVSGAAYINTCNDVTINEMTTFTKRVLITGASNVKINKHVYADANVGTTPTSVATHCIEAMGKCDKVAVENVQNWPGVANCHPYNGVFYCNTVANSTLRYVGTSTTPYDGGTVNVMGYLWSDGGNNADLKFQRCWTTGVRFGLVSGTNTTQRLTVENCYMTDASKTVGPQQLDSRIHGNRFNGGSIPTSYIAVYGNAMWDGFTGDTTTRAALIFGEKTAANPDAYQVTAGTPVFTAQGALVMRSTGDQITYLWPWRILGWNGLVSMASTGTNTANHTFEYDLDKGAGFSGTWKTLSNTNLAAETGIDPVVGFVPKLRITMPASTPAISGNRLDSLRFDGMTTLALQNAALYPLDYAMLSLTGLQASSSVAVFLGVPTPGAVPVAAASNTGTSATLSYEYVTAATSYTVRIRKPGFAPIDLTYANAVAVSIPVAQQPVRDGYGEDIYGRGPGTTASHVTPDGPTLRIDIGNQLCIAEDVYDVVADWQATPTGMQYPEAMRFDGRDLLLIGSWRLRRAIPAYTSAGVDAAVVVDGMPTASPDDETHGSVDIRAKAVRTYSLVGGTFTPADVAAAVWGFTLGTGNTSESELLAAKVAAQNAFAVSA